MSSLFVRVKGYTLAPHPNADSLSLATPNGTDWQCCVKTDNFKDDELAVYIPVDSMLPYDLAFKLGLSNIKEGKPLRVKTIRLRGEVSQGLLIPYYELFDREFTINLGSEPVEDEDVAEVLGITKWVEPDPTSGDTRKEPEGFNRYTDIENIKNYPGVFEEGEEVVATEKIHGSNFRAGWIKDNETHRVAMDAFLEKLPESLREAAEINIYAESFLVGTRRTVLKNSSEDNKWVRVAEKYKLKEKLKDFPTGVVVYGELYGSGIQQLTYGEADINLRLFDVWDGKKYMDYDTFIAFCNDIGVPPVPLIYRGPWNAAVLENRLGSTTIGGKHIREGIVIKPVKERWQHRCGRVILKSVSEDYLLKNYD